jgi:putative ATPase
MDKFIPLAEKMRPKSLDEYVGQKHLLAKGKVFREMIEKGNLNSLILWGPPGVGKTSLARLVSHLTDTPFVMFSAVLQGVKDIKKIVEEAKENIFTNNQNMILFIDEIHRFNKAQQDALLPHVESGTITLIGATTENPSFELISPLLSRCQVYVLEALKEKEIKEVILKALKNKNGLGDLKLKINDDALSYLVNISNGDLRVSLNTLDVVSRNLKLNASISKEKIIEALSTRRVSYDKNGEEHYNLISALHKSMRGSDVQASLYWLSRMIEGGADPMYICRRLVRFASEDIGLSDPNALVQAIVTKDACHFLGYPECNTALAQCVTYLASCPKSNSIYKAINSAKKLVKETRNEPVPLHIRNAPRKLMKDLNYGKNYKYDHDFKNNFSGQSFLPENIKDEIIYEPGNFGFEKEIKKRIEYWKKLKKIF